MQQVQTELIEKQIKQHAEFERQQIENNKIHEKEIQAMKSNFIRTKDDYKVFTQERDICRFVEEDFLYSTVYV
jgi:hypothetical protein